MYLCSAEYNPQGEHTISPTDPALAIDWPSGHELVISDRDAAAPTLDEVRAAGLLPSWDEARAFVEGLLTAITAAAHSLGVSLRDV